MIDFSESLTKEFILSKVSQEEIFARYGVPVQTGVFRSPLRADRHVTCNFYRKGGKLRLRDHAGYFWGDCFDLVMSQFGLTYGKALAKVSYDFLLSDGAVSASRRPHAPVHIEPLGPCDLRVKRREWNKADSRYWKRWDFQQETLNFYHIAALEQVWVNDDQRYAYRGRTGKEAYVYYFGQYDYKCYFPYRDYVRFMHNNSWLLQGYMQLPVSGEVCVITKSLKDVAKLYEFGVPAVAPMSESTLPTPAHMEELSSRFSNLVVFYDNDMAGLRQMVKIRRTYGKTYGLHFAVFPKGFPKDFTDYYEKRGRESTQSLIEHVKTELL